MKPATFDLDLWNKYDYTVLGATCVAIAIRTVENVTDVYRFDLMAAQHVILAINNLLVWCRLLQYFSSSRSIGVLLIMIIEMISDMAVWILITLVFMFAFMVTFYSISEAPDPYQPMLVPVWAMYGEFDTEQMAEWSPFFGQVATRPPL